MERTISGVVVVLRHQKPVALRSIRAALPAIEAQRLPINIAISASKLSFVDPVVEAELWLGVRRHAAFVLGRNEPGRVSVAA